MAMANELPSPEERAAAAAGHTMAGRHWSQLSGKFVVSAGCAGPRDSGRLAVIPTLLTHVASL